MSKLKSMISAREGSVAVEFAILAPVLIFFYLSAISVFDAMRAARQTSQAAMTLSDLASRFSTMDETRLDSLYATSEGLMTLWDDDADIIVTVTSIINPADVNDIEEAEVAWSETNTPGNEIGDDDLDEYGLPAIDDGASLILVEVEGDYTPLFDIPGMDETMNISRRSVLRPRFTQQIILED